MSDGHESFNPSHLFHKLTWFPRNMLYIYKLHKLHKDKDD